MKQIKPYHYHQLPIILKHEQSIQHLNLKSYRWVVELTAVKF